MKPSLDMQKREAAARRNRTRRAWHPRCRRQAPLLQVTVRGMLFATTVLVLAACSGAPSSNTADIPSAGQTLLRLPAPSKMPASPQQAWAESKRLLQADMNSHEGHNLAFYAAEHGVVEAEERADDIFDPFHYRTTEPLPPKPQTEAFQGWANAAEASELFYLHRAAESGSARARLALAYAANPFRTSSSETSFFYVPHDHDCIVPPERSIWAKDARLHFTHGYFAQLVARDAASNNPLLRKCLTRVAASLASAEQVAGNDRTMRANIAYLKAQILLTLSNRFPTLVSSRPLPPVYDGPAILASVFHLDVDVAERQGRELLLEAARMDVGYASVQLGKIDPAYAQVLAAGSSAHQQAMAADLASGRARPPEQAELGMVTIRTLQTTRLSQAEERERFRTALGLVQGAADRGNTQAMMFLADLYAEGRMGWNGPLLEKDSGKAAEWAHKALSAPDIDTISQYPPARQTMEAIARVADERASAERQRQEETRRRDAERAQADAQVARAKQKIEDEHTETLKLLEKPQ